MRIAIGSDHAGLELKTEILSLLKALGHEYIDYGTDTPASVDYPDYGEKVSYDVAKGKVDRGILICGTGIGMSIVANKFRGVRAALVNDLYSARCSREHNDSNVLVIGGRVVGKELAKEIARVWLNTSFAGGRHQKRLEKIEALEKETFK